MDQAVQMVQMATMVIADQVHLHLAQMEVVVVAV
jgi:hypothetical protein